jgi:predicted acetyltransferase
MIQQGKNKYKDALKEMWKLCFPDDSASFINFYFDRAYKNEETLVFIEENKPVASLQMIPYSLKNGTTISTVGYISGAMTHPDFQRKGYMGKLLNASFKVMQKKGYDYTFLIPQEEWLFDFYGKYGYIQAFPKHEEHLLMYNDTENTRNDTVKKFRHSAPNVESAEFLYIYTVYSRFLSAMPCVVLKTESQFAFILQDFFDEKGVLFINDYGIAFTFQKGDTVIIKAFLYRDEEMRQVFLASVSRYYTSQKIIIRHDRSVPVTGYRGMIKSLNASNEEITNIYMDMMLD